MRQLKIRKRIYSTLQGLYLAVFLLAGLSLATAGESISGRLIDSATGAPLEGVLVAATWETCVGIGHCNSFCVAVESTYTDANGGYTLPDGGGTIESGIFYLPGYLISGFDRFGPNQEVAMQSAAAVNETYLDSLGRTHFGCESRPGDALRSAQVNRAILDELLRNRNQFDLEKSIRSTIETIERYEFGYDISDKYKKERSRCVLRQSISSNPEVCFKGPAFKLKRGSPEQMHTPVSDSPGTAENIRHKDVSGK